MYKLFQDGDYIHRKKHGCKDYAWKGLYHFCKPAVKANKDVWPGYVGAKVTIQLD